MMLQKLQTSQSQIPLQLQFPTPFSHAWIAPVWLSQPSHTCVKALVFSGRLSRGSLSAASRNISVILQGASWASDNVALYNKLDNSDSPTIFVGSL
jgi:hypothetical protein